MRCKSPHWHSASARKSSLCPKQESTDAKPPFEVGVMLFSELGMTGLPVCLAMIVYSTKPVFIFLLSLVIVLNVHPIKHVDSFCAGRLSQRIVSGGSRPSKCDPQDSRRLAPLGSIQKH